MLYIKYKNVYFIGTFIIKTLLTISIIINTFIVLLRIRLQSRILIYIGSISYEIYLVHSFIMTLLIDVQLPSFEWIAMICVITVIFAIILNFIDKKFIYALKKV